VPVFGVLAFVSVFVPESLLLVSDLDSELPEVGELPELGSDAFSEALPLLLE